MPRVDERGSAKREKSTLASDRKQRRSATGGRRVQVPPEGIRNPPAVPRPAKEERREKGRKICLSMGVAARVTSAGAVR
jgi:hypothetical protein